MPNHPLLNDTPLCISTSLAANIGLEAAVLLSVINMGAQNTQNDGVLINSDWLRGKLPFWNDDQIHQHLVNLHEQGLLTLSSPVFPNTHEQQLWFANHQTAPQQPLTKTPALHDWQPQADTLTRLEQHGIARSFSLAQRDAFILQGSEQGSSRNDWNTRFFRYVKQQWVQKSHCVAHKQDNALEPWERTSFSPTQPQAQTMNLSWQPSEDAVKILVGSGVPNDFIYESVPEFALYWCERGDAHKTWNSKFIQHVRMQWARVEATDKHAHAPMPIGDQWQPSEDCYAILEMAYIDINFAKNLVNEFTLYWKDSGQVHISWNSRFLQYVKQRWGKQLATQTAGDVSHEQRSNQPSYTTAQASIQRLNDTSWAN